MRMWLIHWLVVASQWTSRWFTLREWVSLQFADVRGMESLVALVRTRTLCQAECSWQPATPPTSLYAHIAFYRGGGGVVIMAVSTIATFKVSPWTFTGMLDSFILSEVVMLPFCKSSPWNPIRGPFQSWQYILPFRTTVGVFLGTLFVRCASWYSRMYPLMLSGRGSTTLPPKPARSPNGACSAAHREGTSMSWPRWWGIKKTGAHGTGWNGCHSYEMLITNSFFRVHFPMGFHLIQGTGRRKHSCWRPLVGRGQRKLIETASGLFKLCGCFFVWSV